MKTALLGGMSLRNKEWIESLQDLFENPTIISYQHWETGELAFEQEVQKLLDLNPDIIFAKSLGTLVAMQAIHQGLKPKKCIFCGIPDEYTHKHNLLIEFKNDIEYTILIKEHDPKSNYQEIEKLHEVIVLEGDNHTYERELIKEYI